MRSPPAGACRRRRIVLAAAATPLLLLAACGGRANSGVVSIEGPDYEPQRIAIETLEPGPQPTPTPTPEPTPEPQPTPAPVPASPPQGARITAASGVQEGAVGSYCWSDRVGGPQTCVNNPPPSQPGTLEVRHQERVMLAIDASIPPNQLSIRPFQGSRSGFPDNPIDPATEVELTIDLPEGLWSMDVCATWHGRGQPICWLFRLQVTA